MIVLHENSKGVTIIREDGKKRSKVRVLGPDGHTLETYRFNNIPFYAHPLLSWANLDCCGGWAFDKEYLYTAVQNGKKPVAVISSASLPDISPAAEIEIWHDPTPITNGPYTWWHMIVARKRTLADLFDIDEIVEAYRRQDVEIDKGELAPYFPIPLITLFQDRFWINPGKLEEWVITGLGLGYPIESTVGIL